MMAGKLERYRPDDAARAIDRMIEQRDDARFPTWAELRSYVQTAISERERQERDAAAEAEDAAFPEEVRRANLARLAELRRGAIEPVSQETAGG